MLDLSIRSNSREEINGKHALIANFLRNTARATVTTATSPATASQPFSVPHTLAKKPDFVMGADDAGASTVGYTDSDLALWTDKLVVVRSALAGVKYRILIVAVG